MFIKKKYIILLFILCLMIKVFPSDEIFVNTQADKTSINVGDVIEYTINIKSGKEILFDFPEKSLKLGDFELLDFSKSEGEENGKKLTSYKYKISIYDVGDFEIPAVTIKYKKNKEEKSITSNGIKIKVNSVLPKDANDIKTIKPPREFSTPFPWRTVYILIAILILLIILSILGLWIYKKYFIKKQIKEKPIPLLPSDEEALKALDELLNSNLLKNGEIKEFYIKLADINRRYLERNFNIVTFERTTEEIIKQLEKKISEISFFDKIKNLLMDFDLVKFAKMLPTNDEAKGHVLKSKSFINETTPRGKSLEGN